MRHNCEVYYKRPWWYLFLKKSWWAECIYCGMDWGPYDTKAEALFMKHLLFGNINQNYDEPFCDRGRL